MNQTIETIHSLRTVHGDFSDREITQTDLDEILSASVKAANASARQSYSIILLEDRERMKELFGYQGSRALIYCVDFTRLKMAAEHLGHKFDEDDIIGFITSSMDVMLAAQTAVIAAKSLGIDSLITNGLHRKNLGEIYASLHLPDTSCFPLISVVLGYPNREPSIHKGRLSLDHVVHQDHYQVPSNEKLSRLISEYDDPNRHLGMIDNWEQQGFKHYLDWFFTKWCDEPVSNKVATGKVLEFQQRLRKSGFWWPEE